MLKVGDLVFLKDSPKAEGLIKEVVKKRVDNSHVDMLYFYRVFWFGGAGNSKFYSESELGLNREREAH
jgi:uncharacterized protein YprB with RNaseH-like and TPR domain